MLSTRSLFLTLGLSLALPTVTLAGPDLRPKFDAATGQIRVTNTGDAEAPSSKLTVTCAAQSGGACPDPAPADIGPYLNPAYPDALVLSVPALGANSQFDHDIAFYDDLVFAPGAYVLTVCADAGLVVAEDAERNNCINVRKSVRGVVSGKNVLTGNTGTN